MEEFIKYLKVDKKVRNFRLFTTEIYETSLGINGKASGGIYNPIQSTQGITGILQVEWSDGKVSFVNITREALSNPESVLKQAEAIKITDEYSKEFLAPYKLEATSQKNEIVKEITTSCSDGLAQLLETIVDFEKSLNLKKHEVQIGSSFKNINFINSKGLKLSNQFTNIEIASFWDMKVYYTIEQRTFPEYDSYQNELKFFGELFKAVNKPLLNQKIDSPKVIILPEQTWLTFEFYLFDNLDGELIANKLSKFKKEDFLNSKKLFASWLDISVNPRMKLTPGAYDFTSEGFEAKKTQFIKEGKLINPMLDLKHAKKLDLQPTIDISSPYTTSLLAKSKKVYGLKEFVKDCDNVILVPYVLGLHTQNKSTGDYSLPAPYSIYIKNGKLIGNVKSILVGNFFEDLKKDDIEFVQTDLFPTPGICYNPRVIVE